MVVFVAVHGGAGVHSISNENEVKRALRLACQKALSISAIPSATPQSALEVVEESISILEDDPNLNAGYGSNLTLDGNVECDAAVMDGLGHFGSVGAVAGVKNPIKLACSILKYGQQPDPLGRVPPLTLVSSGARAFALGHPRAGLELVVPESMISKSARDRWSSWTNKLAYPNNNTELTQKDELLKDLGDVQDTVGAVASFSGHMAAGVSSGGLLLKLPGRVGEAATFGAGCWAQESEVIQGDHKRRRGMACSVSGTGEYITRAELARTIGRAFLSSSKDVDPHEVMHRVLTEDFWGPSRNLGEPSPHAGVLLMTYEDGNDEEPIVRVWCAFTTSAMAIAYASSRSSKAKTLIIRRPSVLPPDDRASVFMTAFTL